MLLESFLGNSKENLFDLFTLEVQTQHLSIQEWCPSFKRATALFSLKPLSCTCTFQPSCATWNALRLPVYYFHHCRWKIKINSIQITLVMFICSHFKLKWWFVLIQTSDEKGINKKKSPPGPPVPMLVDSCPLLKPSMGLGEPLNPIQRSTIKELHPSGLSLFFVHH